jgi:hypothetical protein
MKTMQIFEPAMCCPTGICGVSIDQELLRISTVLNSLKSKNIVVDRFNLSNSPQEFIKNEAVNNFVKEKGMDGLPLTVVDGEIVISGRYPTNDEFVKYLDIPSNMFRNRPTRLNATARKSSICDCSGGNCDCEYIRKNRKEG